MHPTKLQGIIPPMITPLKGDDELAPRRNRTTHGAPRRRRSPRHFSARHDGRSPEPDRTGCVMNSSSWYAVRSQDASPCWSESPTPPSSRASGSPEHAAKCGAVGVVAAPPYYFAPSQQELIEYYTALADALPLPLYLYNMPSHVKVFLEPATVKTLANHPNIIGLKDSSANMTYFQTLLYHLGDNPDFSLYVGPEELTGECVLLGADGGVNGGANIFPELYVAMYDAACAHDIARVREIQRRIMQISTSVYTVGKYGSSYLKGVKCALSLLGVCDDYLSYPYRKFRTEERARIRQALEALGANCNV